MGADGRGTQNDATQCHCSTQHTANTLFNPTTHLYSQAYNGQRRQGNSKRCNVLKHTLQLQYTAPPPHCTTLFSLATPLYSQGCSGHRWQKNSKYCNIHYNTLSDPRPLCIHRAELGTGGRGNQRLPRTATHAATHCNALSNPMTLLHSQGCSGRRWQRHSKQSSNLLRCVLWS